MARSSIISHPLSRRQVLKGGAALGIGSAAAMGLTPAWANPWGRTNVYAQGVEEGPEVSLAIRRESLPIDGQEAQPITINGTSPAPLIRLKEGKTQYCVSPTCWTSPPPSTGMVLFYRRKWMVCLALALQVSPLVKPLPTVFPSVRTVPTGTTATPACRNSSATPGR